MPDPCEVSYQLLTWPSPTMVLCGRRGKLSPLTDGQTEAQRSQAEAHTADQGPSRTSGPSEIPQLPAL